MVVRDVNGCQNAAHSSLRKATSAPFTSEFWNPETCALKCKARQQSSRLKAKRPNGSRHADRSMRCDTPRTQRRTAPRALLTPPASWPLSLASMLLVSLLRDAEVRPGTRARWHAQPRWGHGGGGGRDGTKGARQRRPSARPSPAAACEDRSAEGLSRRSNTQELQTLKKLQSGQYYSDTPPAQARELPCGAWPASPGVLHIPLGAGYFVPFAHRVSAPAEEPARARDVHVTAQALLPARRPPRKRKRRRKQHLPRPSPNTRRPNSPVAATRPLGPAPGAEAAAFPGSSNWDQPTEASRMKKGEAGERHPNSLSLAHEAFVKTVKTLLAGFLKSCLPPVP